MTEQNQMGAQPTAVLAPTAVPWTPPAAVPAQAPVPLQAAQPQLMQPPAMAPQPIPQPQPPQPTPQPPMPATAYAPVPQQAAPRPQQHVQPQPTQVAQAQTPQAMPTGFDPRRALQAHTQTPVQPPVQAQAQPQYAPAPQAYAQNPQMPAQHQQPPQAQMPYGQPHPHAAVTPPPMPVAALQEAPQKSKSLLAGLLNRQPKTDTAAPAGDAKPKADSLFDKKFLMGAAAGLVIGAFVLPMVMDLLIGKPAPQTTPQAQYSQPAVDINAPVEESAFLDEALADEVMVAETP